MIINEVGPLLTELSGAATGPRQAFLLLADAKLEQIDDRRAKLRKLARQIHKDL